MIARLRPIRIAVPLVILLLLSACEAMDSQPPADTVKNLAGQWEQIDGSGSIHFYPDESVKLLLPDENPPLKLLSKLETAKDKQLGISIGDRWTEPVRIKPSGDWQSFDLIFPASPPGKNERTLHFVRRKP